MSPLVLVTVASLVFVVVHFFAMAMEKDDKTPVETPDAKKSSGAWKFNIAGALCSRTSCMHRRDEHASEGKKATRCMLCDCECFFVGGD